MGLCLHERMTAINKLFVELEATSSRTEKEALVKHARASDPLLKDDLDFCFEVLSGKHKIGVTLPEGSLHDSDDKEQLNISIRELCKPLLENNKFDDETLYQLFVQFKRYLWFLSPLFNRVWRIGINRSQLKKDAISPMLAKRYEPNKVYDENTFYLTEKLDGNRCIARYHFDIKAWKFYSRSNKDLKISFDMGDLNKDYIYDGEILSRDQIEHPSQENFNKLSGVLNSKYKNKDDLVYMIFDITNSELPYCKRSPILRAHNSNVSNNVRILPLLEVVTEPKELNNVVKRNLDEVVSRGGEGIMINLGSKNYVHKRTDYLLKVKNVYTMDMRVLSIEMGTGKYEGLVGSLICECHDNDNNCVYTCSVGSGLNDYQRQYWALNPNKIIGKIVEVAYFSTSQSDNSRGTHYYSLRFPRFKGVRDDKKEESVY